MSYRCTWCDHFMLPFRPTTKGGTMHKRCGEYVDRITQETQMQYAPLESWEEQQWRLRKEEEDRL